MQQTMRYFRKQFVEARDIARMQWKSFAVAVLVILFFYGMSLIFAPGWTSYMFIVPPATIVALTALPRVNDIGPEKMGLRWELRKLSLVLVGAGAVMALASPFTFTPIFPEWRTVVLMYGFAGAWMTTPGMPPWDYYISGRYRFLTHPPEHIKSPLERVLTRITGNLDTADLLRAQERWEAEHAKTRRGDGADP